MSSPRWLRQAFNLNLDFWLLLPVLALAFWMGGKVISDRVLSRPYDVITELEANQRTEIELSFTVQVIQVVIDKNLDLTQVKVKTNDSELKKLEFEFPVTEFAQVERAIAKELGLSQEDIRRLARYQIEDSTRKN